ncbi:hypothetical protein D9M71_80780 [compost metagenome]
MIMQKCRDITLYQSFETKLDITEEGYLAIMQGEGDQVLLSPSQMENLLRYYERYENDMDNRWNHGLIEP